MGVEPLGAKQGSLTSSKSWDLERPRLTVEIFIDRYYNRDRLHSPLERRRSDGDIAAKDHAMGIIERGGTTYYECSECGLYYAEEDWARQCEAWCKEYKSCSIEIAKHAVRANEEPRDS